MDLFSFTIFDVVVTSAIAVGGVIGIITGFVRGGLFVLSWIGAIIATFYLLPYVEPITHEYIEPDLLADIVGGGVVFLIGLIALHLVGHIISERVRKSSLKAFDRSLGLLVGLTTPTMVICFLYLFLATTMPPEWLLQSRTQPLIEEGAQFIGRVLPKRLQKASDTLGWAQPNLRSPDTVLLQTEPTSKISGHWWPKHVMFPTEKCSCVTLDSIATKSA